MVMDRSQISLGQSLISALPQVGARGGVRKHGAGWRRCGNQTPGHQLVSHCHSLANCNGTRNQCAVSRPRVATTHTKHAARIWSQYYQQDPARTGELRPR